jgi:hypothetical protein
LKKLQTKVCDILDLVMFADIIFTQRSAVIELTDTIAEELAIQQLLFSIEVTEQVIPICGIVFAK